ncbi:MAG: hypothetical protein JO172_13410 [Hyphomicrobiales bacterium]|nr:hypothetical protein [Hyphomicrobiales bacterium]
MPDPWMNLEPNESSENIGGEGAKWVVTTGLALALVVLLALFALKAS